MPEKTARQLSRPEPGTAAEELHDSFRQPFEAGGNGAGLHEVPASRIDLGAVAGGNDDTFAETLPVRVSGSEGNERLREHFCRDGQALQELQGSAVMAHPDAEKCVFERGSSAHFGLISPRQGAFRHAGAPPADLQLPQTSLISATFEVKSWIHCSKRSM
jgi:hypothetical protein